MAYFYMRPCYLTLAMENGPFSSRISDDLPFSKTGDVPQLRYIPREEMSLKR